ncbi:MAG TPA: Crp/Fnr family transcriptional regulator [Blastocatellia bacterium]|nr:Crp/Fnr family transcriptional regulator [Blastocatellia bacterium]
MSQPPDNRRTKNFILRALPAPEYNRLAPYLQPVTLAQGEVIYDTDAPIRLAYFPDRGMFSLLSTSVEGEIIEVAMVSNAGMLGTPIIWGSETIPYRVIVQIPGSALALRVPRLKDEFNRHGRLHDLLLHHTYALVKQISQSAICNRFHSIRQRLCRWLLIVRDHVKTDEFLITQDYIAYMLGSRRERITEAANALQRQGLIRYKRGRIVVLDRPGLEATSCECYSIIKETYKKSADI